MPAYRLENPVVLFNHPEYGPRLLFKNGIANPRDQLGKNGVSIHSRVSALFYKTICIESLVTDESGRATLQKFYINRNSLVKYLGEEEHKNLNDNELINCSGQVNLATVLEIPQ